MLRLKAEEKKAELALTKLHFNNDDYYYGYAHISFNHLSISMVGQACSNAKLLTSTNR